MKLAVRPKRSLFKTALLGGLFTGTLYAICYFGSQQVASSIMVGLMKYSIGLVGVVWLFSLNVYNKLSDVTDLPGLDYRQHRNLEVEVQQRLQSFWIRAFFLAVVALAMYLPSILNDAKQSVPAWVFGTAGAGLALAIFSLRTLLREMEEIRELKSHVKELERQEKERLEIVKTLKDDAKTAWVPDQRLDGFRKP